MLHDTQRTSAPRSTSVSIRTAVCTVMCKLPMIFAPLSGCLPRYSARTVISPGISCSARRISLRPHSASERSATLNAGRSAACADSRRANSAIPMNVFLCDETLTFALLRNHREHRGPFRLRIGGENPVPRDRQARVGHPGANLLLGNALPDVSHLRREVLALMGSEIEDDQAAGRREHP